MQHPQSSRRQRLIAPVPLVVAGVVIVIISFTLHYILSNGINVPYLDEWSASAAIAIATARGELGLHHLFLQNNEHRHLSANLASALLVPLSAWDLRVQMLMTLFMAVISFLLLLDIMRGRDRRAVLLMAIPVALLIFSLRQRQTWLWAYLLTWTQGIAALIFGLWALDRLKIGWGGVAGAILGAFGVLFSLAYGIVAWGIYPVLMWVRGYRKPAHYGGFFAAAAVIIGLFFSNYDFSVMGWDGREQSAGLSTDPLRLGYFLLANLGSPVTPFFNDNAPLAAVIGTVMLALLIANGVYLWRRYASIQPFAVWIALALFGLAICGVIAVGRSLPFPDQIPFLPIHDRYTPPPSLVWIALIALVVLAIRQGARRLAVVNSGLLLIAGVFYAATLWHMPTLGVILNPETAACMRQFPATRNMGCANAYLSGTSPRLIADRMNDLSILGLSAFAGQPPVYTAITPFYQLVPRVLDASPIPAEFQYRRLTPDFAAHVLFQHPNSRMAFDLTLPDRPGRILFNTALFVDRSNLIDTTRPQDGVIFSAAVQVGGAEPVVLLETLVDPAVVEQPTSVEIDISQYRGQPVTILLATDDNAGDLYDWALWVDPNIQVRPED